MLSLCVQSFKCSFWDYKKTKATEIYLGSITPQKALLKCSLHWLKGFTVFKRKKDHAWQPIQPRQYPSTTKWLRQRIFFWSKHMWWKEKDIYPEIIIYNGWHFLCWKKHLINYDLLSCVLIQTSLIFLFMMFKTSQSTIPYYKLFLEFWWISKELWKIS